MSHHRPHEHAAPISATHPRNGRTTIADARGLGAPRARTAHDGDPAIEPVPPRFDLPNLGIGIGLRTVHFGSILESPPQVDWFEAISENFMDVRGRPAWVLEQVAERHPVVLHGVSLSIGSTDPLDRDYLASLKRLATSTRARWVSDHLCWTGVARRNLHDLLPLPYTEECLRHVVERVRIVQDVLERPLVLENPSSYVAFASSTMSEWEFLARMAEEADCGLLLDVNNAYVSAFNHGFDAYEYLAGIPMARVVQFHVAGHTHKGTHILDTHTGQAVPGVWELLEHACRRTGGRSVLYEWDDEIPAIEVVVAEAERARGFTGMTAGSRTRAADAMHGGPTTRPATTVARSANPTRAEREAAPSDESQTAARKRRAT